MCCQIIDKKRINIGTPEAPNCIPDLAGYFRDQMLALVRRKAPFAKQVHGGVAIGGKPLNVLFDNPEDLLKLLVSEKLVDPKHPRDSKLIALMQFEGPMYRVFSIRSKPWSSTGSSWWTAMLMNASRHCRICRAAIQQPR